MATTTATKTAKPASKTAAAKKPKIQEPDLYFWEGKNQKGQVVRGEIKARSLADVKNQLRKQGQLKPKIKKKPKPLFGGGKAVQPADIAVFVRQMATMMKAGVPLVQSFELVADGLENENMRKMVLSIRDDVSGGGSFGSGLRRFPKYFDELFCSPKSPACCTFTGTDRLRCLTIRQMATPCWMSNTFSSFVPSAAVSFFLALPCRSRMSIFENALHSCWRIPRKVGLSR